MSKYARARELYNKAFGDFITVNEFYPENWLYDQELKEYQELQKIEK